MKPRVLLVTGSLGPGGTELAVLSLAHELRLREHVVPRVAVLARGGHYAEHLRAHGVPCDELEIDGPLRRPAAIARLLRLRGLVRTHGIDVVQTFLFDADVYGMLAAKLGGPRAIVTTRRAIKANRPHHLRGYRLTNRFVDRIVANSEAVRRFTLEHERAPAGKVVVIPNGAALARFEHADGARFRERLGLGGDVSLIGAVGTIKPVKGQRELFDALAPYLREHARAVLLLAGEITRDYGEALLQTVREARLEGRVLLPGVIADVPDLLAALDLFVLPSRSEGMSNALIEAMASGCAIVATDVGGNRECLDDGACGVLVPARDVRAMHDAVAHLLADGARRSALGSAARARAHREYALATSVSRYEALYRELLGATA